ncbi:tellurite resistance TerB family protein [Halovulum sp. GXIMD14793]
MLQNLLNRLIGAEPPQDTETDYRTAMAALLVRCARADDDYATAEIETIDRVLSARYALTPEAAAALRAEGEALEAEANDTVQLTRAIKQGVPYEQRFAVVEALWRVVLADDDRAAEENALLRLVTDLLGVSDRDSGLARQAAARD